MYTKLCTSVDEITEARNGGDKAAVQVAGGILVLDDGFAGFATSEDPAQLQMKGVFYTQNGPHLIEVPA